MTSSTRSFYDHLAESYHLIFGDWRRSVHRQGETLDRLIHVEMGIHPHSVLDCSCGIGTQAIGLALRGYDVHATDLSPLSVERARTEASAFGASISFGTADFRSLAADVPGLFDVVISCDNSLSHLLTDEDLLEAARNIRSKLRPGGLFLGSIRDYDELLMDRPRSTMPAVFDGPEGRRIYFQVWDWAEDGRTYTLHLFILTESGGGWATQHHETQYRAMPRAEVSRVLREAGFETVKWHMPDDTGYYQPIVTALKDR